MRPTSFVDILCNTTSLTSEQLAKAKEVSAENGMRLEESLLQQRAITEEELLQAQSQHLGLPYWKELPEGEFDTALMTKVPLAFARQHKLIPIRIRDGNVLVAAGCGFNHRHHRSFNVASPTSARMVAMIQNRMTMVDSAQPFCSK